MTNTTRATKGGEYGVNGSFYQGGEFLPTSPNTIKGEFKTEKMAKKVASQNTITIQDQINEILSDWYPNHTTAQARELFVKYLKDNGINTYRINPYSKDLAEWII